MGIRCVPTRWVEGDDLGVDGRELRCNVKVRGFLFEFRVVKATVQVVVHLEVERGAVGAA